jgi:hypothetical protein
VAEEPSVAEERVVEGPVAEEAEDQPVAEEAEEHETAVEAESTQETAAEQEPTAPPDTEKGK